MRWLGVLAVAAVCLLLIGCSEEEGGASVASSSQGWHFQGRDCLACHNSDLGEDKQLLYGATLYKSPQGGESDALEAICGGEFVVNFLDANYALQRSSKDHETPGSKGYLGKGNIFVLQRELSTLHGEYYIQIAEKTSGMTLAQSMTLHAFDATDYSVEAPMDINNRRSCNACHNDNAMSSRLYAQINSGLCQ